MTDPDVAQAHLLIAALRHQLRDMAPQLARVDATCPGPGRPTSRTRALRREAATLRRDVDQAHFLIARLLRRFPVIDTAAAAQVAADNTADAAVPLNTVTAQRPPSGRPRDHIMGPGRSATYDEPVVSRPAC